MDEKLISRYLNNRCSSGEVEEILAWFEDQAGTYAGRTLIKKVWEEYSLEKDRDDVDYETILDRIHHRINLLSVENQGAGKRKQKWSFIQVLARAAAILFLPVFSLLLYTYFTNDINLIQPTVTSWSEITTQPGSRINMQLPDGTDVWLNHGSKLKYPLKFSGSKRVVELSGEAFFEVYHDSNRPFLVEAGELGILATGTEFNVSAYPDDETVEATLVSGKINIQQLLGNGAMKQLYEVSPNQHASYRKEIKKLAILNGDPGKYISWKEDKIIFENDPIDEIFKRLGRWFNVDFQLEDQKLSEYTFTATFIDETLPQVLDLMELASPIAYTILPRKKRPDGSFTRRKVIVRYKR